MKGAESSDLAQSAPSGTGLDQCVYVKEGEKGGGGRQRGTDLVVEYDGQSDMKERNRDNKGNLERESEVYSVNNER